MKFLILFTLLFLVACQGQEIPFEEATVPASGPAPVEEITSGMAPVSGA